MIVTESAHPHVVLQHHKSSFESFTAKPFCMTTNATNEDFQFCSSLLLGDCRRTLIHPMLGAQNLRSSVTSDRSWAQFSPNLRPAVKHAW